MEVWERGWGGAWRIWWRILAEDAPVGRVGGLAVKRVVSPPTLSTLSTLTLQPADDTSRRALSLDLQSGQCLPLVHSLHIWAYSLMKLTIRLADMKEGLVVE